MRWLSSPLRTTRIPKTPAELVNYNCLLFGGLLESADWPFIGPEGRFSVSVHGNLSSNSFKRFGPVSWQELEFTCLPRSSANRPERKTSLLPPESLSRPHHCSP
jgi:hypothetical protein